MDSFKNTVFEQSLRCRRLTFVTETSGELRRPIIYESGMSKSALLGLELTNLCAQTGGRRVQCTKAVWRKLEIVLSYLSFGFV